MQSKRELRHAQLNEELPHLNGDFKLLDQTLRRMDVCNPARKKWSAAVRMFFGLDREVPLDPKEIAPLLSVQPAWVREIIKNVLRRLKHPQWKDPLKWPEPQLSNARSKMRPGRVGDIAVFIAMRRLQTVSRKYFVRELRAVWKELRLPAKELSQFVLAIEDRLMQRK
jgi:hypothetical protein